MKHPNLPWDKSCGFPFETGIEVVHCPFKRELGLDPFYTSMTVGGISLGMKQNLTVPKSITSKEQSSSEVSSNLLQKLNQWIETGVLEYITPQLAKKHHLFHKFDEAIPGMVDFSALEQFMESESIGDPILPSPSLVQTNINLWKLQEKPVFASKISIKNGVSDIPIASFDRLWLGIKHPIDGRPFRFARVPPGLPSAGRVYQRVVLSIRQSICEMLWRDDGILVDNFFPSENSSLFDLWMADGMSQAGVYFEGKNVEDEDNEGTIKDEILRSPSKCLTRVELFTAMDDWILIGNDKNLVSSASLTVANKLEDLGWSVFCSSVKSEKIKFWDNTLNL